LTLSEEAAEKILNSLKRIQERKAIVLSSMIKEAHDFKSLGKIRLEKDEGHLLRELEKTIELEDRYITRQIRAIRSIRRTIQRARNNLFYYFIDKNIAQDFFSYIDNIFALFSEGYSRIIRRLRDEEAFILEWGGGAISHFFTFRREKVLNNFKQKITELLRIYGDEAAYKRSFVGRLKGCKDMINKKASMVLANENIAERPFMGSIVKGVSKATSSYVDSSTGCFNLGWAVAGDLVDNGKFDVSAGWTVGGFFGGMRE
jgi:hypothetical protein